MYSYSMDSMTQLSDSAWLALTVAALEAVVTLLLAFTQIYFLQQSRTGFSHTDTTISRITILTIHTGLLTSSVATLCMIFVSIYHKHWSSEVDKSLR